MEEPFGELLVLGVKGWIGTALAVFLVAALSYAAYELLRRPAPFLLAAGLIYVSCTVARTHRRAGYHQISEEGTTMKAGGEK